MKKLLSLLFALFLLFPLTTRAETKWQDFVTPAEEIKNAKVVVRIDHENLRWYTVGADIPAGLYRITPGSIQGMPTHDQYMIFIMRGAETVAQSEMLDTETDADFVFYLQDGDHLYAATSLGVLYLSSIDDRFLRISPFTEEKP